MHMADALLSPAVGGTMWAAAAGLAAYAARKVRQELDGIKVPLMGVLGAFIFAAQMLNFSIPGTGSSGHLGGGMILAILLGPYAGFITMASVLTVQALFFADGGLLALGCNIFNLGFFPCFIAYPLIFKPIVKDQPSRGRIFLAASLAGIVSLQLGAFSAVLETVASGISSLPFKTFVLLMQPIHLAIGAVEGLVTTAVITFVWQARPEILQNAATAQPYRGISIRRVLIGLILAAAVAGGALSWFASAYPDGLEWSMFHASGREELETSDNLHESLAEIQKKTAILPDYGFKEQASAATNTHGQAKTAWPAVNGGTSVSGLVGAAITLVLVGLVGLSLWLVKRRRQN